MKTIGYFLVALLLPNSLHADEGVPLLRPDERQAVDTQAEEFNKAVIPALKAAAQSTVRIWSGPRRLAYGTVVGDGSKILSKWSEIARAQGKIQVEAGHTGLRDLRLVGVYQDEDIAELEVEGPKLIPVKWTFEKPQLGSFMIASQPDGRPAAFGVVSVLERNLRETDQSFLGIAGNPAYPGLGVEVDEVTKGSGAEAAGIKRGDIVTKVGERTISGLLELKNALTEISPGRKATLIVKTGESFKKVNVLLGNRPKMPTQFGGARLEQMERMGGAISQVRDSFTHAIQTDMRPKPNQIGGPVADLKGEVIGITMARADRTRSFVMPASAVEELLKKPPVDPSIAQINPAKQRDEQVQIPATRTAPHDQMVPGSVERMRRQLSDMQRLMDYMREEMNNQDPDR
jgi:serine protease Do